MAIVISYDSEKNILNIQVEGDFTLTQREEFCQSYQEVAIPKEKYLVDHRHTHYIDSTALGMLVELRKFAKAIT